MELALRPYRASDFEMLARWYDRRELFVHAIGERSLEAALPGLLTGKPGLRILAAEEGRPVGLIASERRNLRNGAVLWIRMLLVEPGERRKGYGRAAIARLFGLEGVGAGAAIHRVLVAVDEANEEGMAFWLAQGFRPLHTLKSDSSARPVHILVWEVRPA